MNAEKINKILWLLFWLLLFTIFAVIIFKFGGKNPSARHGVAKKKGPYALKVVPGPSYPVREVEGYLPEGKILFGELVRRGVPSLLSSKWSRKIKSMGIYNLKGDWFLASWSPERNPYYFEYLRPESFMVKWSPREGWVKNSCGSQKFYVATGYFGVEGFYWSLRMKIPGRIVYQIWDALQWRVPALPLLEKTRWEVLYTTRGVCPDRLLFLSLAYPDGITESFVYFPYKGVNYFDANGGGVRPSLYPLYPPGNIELFENGMVLFKFPSFILTPFSGRVDSLSPLIISSKEDKMKCETEEGKTPGYLRRGGRISAGSIVLMGVKRANCDVTLHRVVLPSLLKKQFLEKYFSYFSFFGGH